MTSVDLIESSREAMAHNSWPDAYELWRQADQSKKLGPVELEDFALSAWWTGQPDRCIDIRERAYSAYHRNGDDTNAGKLALQIAEDHFHKGSDTLGRSWLKRAIDLLGTEGETIEAAWLMRAMSVVAFEADNDLDRALKLSEKAYQRAVELGDPNLQALTLHDRGRVMVAGGDVEGGMRLMDEAMVGAVGGELEAVTTGRIYCNMIDICEQLADYRKAGDWSDAAKRWCERAGNNSGFPGVCRIHRADIMKLRGDWAGAEAEASKASEELGTFLSFAGEAMYEIGEIRLHMGDYEHAEEAFRQAHGLGRDPQPGLARLELARGRPNAAWSMITRSLDPTEAPLKRARLLPTAVEIALADGNLDAARAGWEELEQIAEEYETSALVAHAEHARGALLLAEGDAIGACERLRHATDLRLRDDLPYLAARSRMLLAQAYQQQGDVVLADLEYSAALSAFTELGAMPDVLLAKAAIEGVQPDKLHSDRRIAALMFTDIVDSTALIRVIGDDPWESLLRWHHRTLRSLFADHDGHEVENTGDGFFVAFDRGEDAIACAIEIQNRLAAHRREQGFAPRVRIGINQGEVTEVSSTLAGEEVHRAARICAAAEADEILITVDLEDQIPPGVTKSTHRLIEMKGFSERAEVISLRPA